MPKTSNKERGIKYKKNYVCFYFEDSILELFAIFLAGSYTKL